MTQEEIDKCRKINLGCGSQYISGFINFDLYSEANGIPNKVDVYGDVTKLPFPDERFDFAYSSHVIEHFSKPQGLEVLKEWRRVLSPEGTLHIECPNLDALCEKYVSSPNWMKEWIYIQFYGRWEIPGHGHQFVYNKRNLQDALIQAGFTSMIEIPALRYTDISELCQAWLVKK